MTRFEFATASRVVFGAGTLQEAGRIVRPFGRHALVVMGRSPERAARLHDILSAEGVRVTPFAINGEPDTDIVGEGASLARDSACDVVIGIGGGSAMDAAKAIATLAANSGDLFDYLEVVGKGRPLASPSWPCVAIPTTAGTGSEVTRNAVLTAKAHQVKVSLRSPSMLPAVALVDPDLTADLPRRLTASTGLDALTQLIEPYLSSRSSPMTDAICVEGMRRAAEALRRAFRNGDDRDAREQMALASLWSGMALANAGLGAVHGLAGPIGGLFRAPHGAICAALLPHVIEINHRAIDTRAPASPVLARFDDVARLLTGRPTATARDAVAWLRRLVADLEIPGLGTYGIGARDVDAIASRAKRASSMKGNPIELTAAELGEVVLAAL